jgi:hypothetical protein
LVVAAATSAQGHQEPRRLSATTAAFLESGHASAWFGLTKRLVRFPLLALRRLDDWNDIPDDLRQMILKALAG